MINSEFKMSATKVTPAYSGVQYPKTNSCVFDTKEEFIAYLIRNNEIKKDTSRYNDDMIHLSGTLKIDDRVKKGLNWNDVVATSAIVEDGMISRYQYLPRTHKGIKTALDIPSLELYMLHNNFSAICTNNTYAVDLFRIPANAGHLDFSSVSANLTLFYGQRIALSKLPKSKGVLGLSPASLEVDCPNAYRVAKEKGCGTDILNVLRPQNMFTVCVNKLFGQKT